MTPGRFTDWLAANLERDGVVGEVARFVGGVVVFELAELPPERGGLGDIRRWLADHSAPDNVVAAADVAWAEHQHALAGPADPKPILVDGEWEPATPEQERAARRIARRFDLEGPR